MIEPDAKTLRAEVLEFIRSQARGATDEEQQDGLGMDPNTQRPRRVELLKPKHGLPLIYASGTRKTKSGRSATVWHAVVPLCEEK